MSLFQPASIAVIGASATPGKVGHDVFKNLVTQGFQGKVFPVNPKGGTILGQAVYPSVGAIGDSVDLAIVITPAATVPGVLKECGEKGIKSTIVISAGFKETATVEGKTLEEDVRKIAKQYSMDVLGPNCLGLLRPSTGLNASFAKELPPQGGVALISQSGAFAVAVMDAAGKYPRADNKNDKNLPSAGIPARDSGFGFSLVLSIGNKTVLDETDFLERAASDPDTRVIGLYLESIEDGMRFREAAAQVGARKPIVLLKAGTTAFGRRAAASHTGALAGRDRAIDALCAETNIHRAHSLEEFMDLLCVLSTQPPLLTQHIAIVTNAGGPGILAADAAADARLSLPPLSGNTERQLREKLPLSASTKNPIDLIGDAGADRYRAALEACIEDPVIDGLAILLTPQVMTPVREIAEVIISASKKTSLMPIVASFMGGASVAEARALLTEHGIPCFETPERAVQAIAALIQRTAGKYPRADYKNDKNIPSAGIPARGINQTRRKSAATILGNKHGLLSEDDTARLLKLYNLPLPAQHLARSLDEAIVFAQTIGYPVVAKISAPEILHKTDVGGIRGDIETEQELADAFRSIMANVKKRAPHAAIRGILIQKFLPVGSELIIGGLRDPSFGPLVMAGLGGIYTELFRDTAFRLAPLTEEEAYTLLQQLKVWKMLLGVRGKEQADIAAIARIIVGVSSMLLECPSIQELDFNPVLVSGKDVTIADAKIVL